MILQQLVRTSLLVADTSSRLAKIKLLAALLRQAAPEEIEIVIAYLSGSVRQSKLGLGRGGLSGFTVRLIRPIRPMLARAAAGVQDALPRLGTAAFEYKLDGARIQVHKSGTDIRVFSRLMNDVTVAVPEIVEAVRAFGFEDAILDGEAIVMDAGGRPLSFQSTMRRFGRKLDVEEWRGELPLPAFFFDLLHADGSSLLAEPYAHRYDRLAQRGPETRRPQHLGTGDAPGAPAVLGAANPAGAAG